MIETRKPPTVSVIIPTYNRAHLISRAIKSVLNQTYQDFELVVIDDGSKDNTENVIKSFDDARIEYVRLEKNRGAAVARNRGIGLARGKFIAFQDSDDEWLPQKIAKQMRVFQTVDSDVEVVYTDMLRVSRENGKTRYWSSPDVIPGRVINEKTLDYQVKYIGLIAILIKKECLDKVGLFDERLSRFIDLDFFIRLSNHYRFYHVKEPLAKYYETTGVSSDARGLAMATILLLEKYFKDCKHNKKFLAKQYFEAAKSFYASNDLLHGIYYLTRAIKIYPLIIKRILVSFLPKSRPYGKSEI